MRRSYISPEFDYVPAYGTYNMSEEGNFFGSKMLEIEDSIYVGTENIIYHQNQLGEQIDEETEKLLEPGIYSSSESKLSSHSLYIDESQTQSVRNENTKWILDIDIRGILRESLFAKIKSNRTFQGIRSNMTIYNDVNTALLSYIEKNVIDRYKFSKLDLYIGYVDLKNQNVLRFKNTWSENTATPSNATSRFQTETDYNQRSIRVRFSQERPSTTYKMDYFFNISFDKI
jgi:hypothetical protein